MYPFTANDGSPGCCPGPSASVRLTGRMEPAASGLPGGRNREPAEFSGLKARRLDLRSSDLWETVSRWKKGMEKRIPDGRRNRNSAHAGDWRSSFRREKQLILGYRDELLSPGDESGKPRTVLCVATEDGSVGTRGNVLDAIREQDALRQRSIFACGPDPMLRAVKQYAAGAGHPLLYFPGGADGLRDRSMSGLRLPVQGSGRAHATYTISGSARTVRYF